MNNFKSNLFWYLTITVLIFSVYFSALFGDFLFWDDYQNILENMQLIRGDFNYFFSQPHLGMYIPIVYTSWSFIYKFFGSNSVAFHFFNLFLHINNTFLLYLIAKKLNLTRSLFWTAAGVILFAVHPLQIETVSWISGTRDLMAALFALLSVYTLLSNSIVVRYLLSPLFYILGLLCKISIAPLPFIILFVRLILIGKITKSYLYDFILNIIFIIPISMLTYATQSNFHVINSNLGFINRFLIALDSIGFYLTKLFIPIDLSADYGRTPKFILQNMLQYPQYIIISAIILFILAIFKFNKKLLVFLAIFIGFLLPVLGFVDFIYQNISSTSDRYMYLPIIAIALGLITLGSNISKNSHVKNISKFCVSIFLFFLILISVQQVKIWKDNLSFFTNMLIKNNQSYSAYQNLALYYFKSNQLSLASENFKRAYEIQPNIFANFANFYIMQERLGNYDNVLAITSGENNFRLQQGKAYQPVIWANLMNSLAVSLFKKADYQSALIYLCEVIHVFPDHSIAIQNLEKLQPFLNTTETIKNICH